MTWYKEEMMNLEPVHQQIFRICQTHPHRIAIRYEEKAITYFQLEQEAHKIANFLYKKRETQKYNPNVIVILDRSPELIQSILGLFKSGLVFVPFDPQFPENRLKILSQETQAEWIITSTSFLKKFDRVIEEKGLNVLLVDGNGSFDDYSQKIKIFYPGGESGNLQFETMDNQHCYIYFTSGSTGVPRGVLGRQKSLSHFIQWEIQEFGIDEHFKVSQLTNPTFDPFLRDILVPLAAGGTSCIPVYDTLMNAEKLIRWIDRHKITLIHIVPSLFKEIQKIIVNSDCLCSLEYILFAGESLRGNDIRKFIEIFGARIQLVNLYGPTETTLAKFFYRIVKDDINRHIIPVGKPIPGAQAFILNQEMKKCLAGNIGEIYIRTPFISSGYFNNKALTASVFIKSPFGDNPHDFIYKSGDLGRLLLDGNIELVGRVDNQVKIMGHRIEMGEIENHLLEYNGIKTAVVTTYVKPTGSSSDSNGDEKKLCAYIVLDEPALRGKKEFDISQLKGYLRKIVPGYMVPSYFVMLDKMPLNPNGKVDRKSLPEPTPQDAGIDTTYAAPKDDVEKRIARIWKEILKLEEIGINNNFFELGGNSLRIMEMVSKLTKEFRKEIPVTKLFEHPTIASLAKYLREMEGVKNDKDQLINKNRSKRENAGIAVIGISCRFPGTRNLEEFWENLKEGRETITFLSDEELLNAGVSPDLLSNPNYVRGVSQITNKEYFDARFFGYTPKEAELLDPQIRLFHECSWEAMEDGGIDPELYKGLIGVYAGAVQNLEWEIRTTLSGKSRTFGSFAASKLAGIRYLCTRLSYNLNLKGPSVTMQTACSTSLVAIHMACRALSDGECDAAVAGGVTVSPEGKWGYLYEENMIYSPDGHCRSFDAKGNGTVFGEGVGVVVLKPLKDAIADGDNIYAVIKGSAINNDGNRKVGFTAPSVPGQVEVIRAALQSANVEPESISYIETHGTATTLGDPIEIEALEQVFNTDKKKYCKIGSVKSNFGHLDAAAGVASFIKTVLSLKYRQIPPSLYYESPNPSIDFDNTPFEVNTRLLEWENGKYPLRAGITSLGMGGTNGHIILEEAPKKEESSQSRKFQIILLSANSENSLDMAAKNLADFLRKHDNIKLADVAYTLQTGRKRFNHRRMFTCSGTDEAIEKLLVSTQDDPSLDVVSTDENPAIVFMFSGQGSQYVNMGLELYDSEPVFREEMDRCFSILDPLTGNSLKEILYPGLNAPGSGKLHEETKDINQTEITQPVIFALEYSLARLLIYWGIEPELMIGHSIGEYTAACLSGVLSLEDALKMVVLRGKLMQKMPTGSMLSVPLSEDELKPLLNEELEIAAVNSSALCVVSGTDKAIEKFAKRLEKDGHKSRKLVTSYAFHSRMMDPVLPEFEAKVKQFHFKKPGIPYISNLTGDWISGEDAVNSNYWARQLRETVRFSEGLEKLLSLEKAIYIEVGPGNALSKFANFHSKKTNHHIIMNLVRHPMENVSDIYYLLNKIGRLWIHGKRMNWDSFYSNEKRHRIFLPPYPFDRQYYWIEKIDYNNFKSNTRVERKTEIADWFYIPSWEQSVILPGNKVDKDDRWNLVFMDDRGLGSGLLNKFERDLEKTIRVTIGTAYSQLSNLSYTINPESDEDYEKLFRSLSDANRLPVRIVHMWNVTGPGNKFSSIESTRKAQDTGFYSLINISKAIGNIMQDKNVDIITITDNMHDFMGSKCTQPEKSTILGPINVISQEYSNIKCRCIDIAFPGNNEKENDILLSHLYSELSHESPAKIIAYRDNRRWVHTLKPVKLPGSSEIPSLLKPRGVYLITGGLGGIGLVLAEYLAKTVKPKLVITGRSDFPSKGEWDNWLQQYGPEDKTSKKINKLKSMEESGAQIFYVQVDVSNPEEMKNKLKAAERELGEIKGILHTAGIADFAGIIHRRTREENEKIFAPKLAGTLILDNIFRDRKLDFFVLFSSMSSLCAHFGQVGYSSANAFLDAFAAYKAQNEETFTLSINWESWTKVGMAAEGKKQTGNVNQVIKEGISPEEGVEVFIRSLNHRFSNLAVSTINFKDRLARHQLQEKKSGYESPGNVTYKPLFTKAEDFVFSYNSIDQVETQMTEIWRELLGHEQIRTNDNFFELGGDSLTAIHMRKRINEVFNIDIPLVKIYHFPTIKLLVKNLLIQGDESNRNKFQQEEKVEVEEDFSELDIDKSSKKNDNGSEIAVIGMSGRFSDAENIEGFWTNLENGKESITFFTDEELKKAGVEPELLEKKNYVKASGFLDYIEYFDASFFGYTPNEAEILNPQTRLFYECVYEALEDAGYVSHNYNGLIGLYAGASINLGWDALTYFSGKSDMLGQMASTSLSNKDNLSTRISYKLNLKGPSISLRTACSTSLVAIHLACKALLMNECDIALAGGVAIQNIEKRGYIYQEGLILSPDGHCRPFNSRSNGTVFGNGAGVTVLKKLKNALKDRDHIYAVIKGSAINNDGFGKVGYTAPGVEGQANVIISAQKAAGVDPESIGYIETHGTGTRAGDSIEIEALKLAFNTGKRNFCCLGFVKSNIGHLDTAAGAAGFIKTVMVLKHKLIPPALHFETSHPEIDFENSPFYINKELKEWKTGNYPLRAGVSSFGLGGTNAHVVLEEAPVIEQKTTEKKDERAYSLILLSAKKETALERIMQNLLNHFKKNPHLNLSDAAYTLQVGRFHFQYRKALVCSTIDDAIDALSSQDSGELSMSSSGDENRPVIFMFSGQGSQYVNMGLELYTSEPVFREEMNRCFAILNPLIGCDLKKILYPGLNNPGPGKIPGEMNDIYQTEITQPAVFAIEYSLARLLIKWGIKPNAMIGHSIGEYTAACISGVLSLEDALKIVVLRGKLMQKMSPGSMLSVPLSENELKPLLNETLDLAAVNSSSFCVLSGTDEDIETFSKKIKAQGYECRKLVTSFAFHSRMMDPMLQEFDAEIKKFHFEKPGIPYISNLTGNWITGEDLNNSNYWSRHLRETVRFSEGIETLFSLNKAIFVEVGPGNTLSKFANLHSRKSDQHIVMNLLKHPQEKTSDVYYLLNKIGRLWMYGQAIDWLSFYSNQKRYRISLPTYAFDKNYYWIEPIDYSSIKNNANLEKKRDVADWFYIPSWRRTFMLSKKKIETHQPGNEFKWLFFIDDFNLGENLIKHLKQNIDNEIIIANVGEQFSKLDQGIYTVNPQQEDDYRNLFNELELLNMIPRKIIHLWGVSGGNNKKHESESDLIAKGLTSGFYSILYLTQAIAGLKIQKDYEIIVITDHSQDVLGNEFIFPGKSPVLGVIATIPREHGNINCRSIDISFPGSGNWEEDRLIDNLILELTNSNSEIFTAYRNDSRWVQGFHQARLECDPGSESKIKENGVYLIIEGLSGIGFILTEHLAKSYKAKLVILEQVELPEKNQWNNWLSSHDHQSTVTQHIKKVRELEEYGSEVLIFNADAASLKKMQYVIAETEKRLGPIDGIIHVTRKTTRPAKELVHELNQSNCERQFKPIIDGIINLKKLFKDKAIDFCVLNSSILSFFGGLTSAAYSADDIFMNTLVRQADGWISVNWDNADTNIDNDVETSLSPGELIDAFELILNNIETGQIIVSTSDLYERIEKLKKSKIHKESPNPENENDSKQKGAFPLSSRPGLSSNYFKSISDTENKILNIWQKLLGNKKIGLNDNFFELGGDSLTAVEVRNRIEEVFNVEIPVVKILHHPTVHSFVEDLLKENRLKDDHTLQQENQDKTNTDFVDILNKF
jgi:amino acid adenylation domain-containing protein